MVQSVTTIDELKIMSQGEVVELPPFVSGQHFYAKLRRPSLLKLVEQGKIPNALMKSASTLFSGEVTEQLLEDENFMGQMFKVIDVLAESVFVQPSWEEIKTAGIDLTDEQYMFIFNYTQRGVNSLDPFPEESGDPECDLHGENVQL